MPEENPAMKEQKDLGLYLLGTKVDLPKKMPEAEKKPGEA